jgi:hypothetical protein
VKGLSSEIVRNGKDQALVEAEVKMDTSKRLEVEAFPESKTLACMTE